MPGQEVLLALTLLQVVCRDQTCPAATQTRACAWQFSPFSLASGRNLCQTAGVLSSNVSPPLPFDISDKALGDPNLLSQAVLRQCSAEWEWHGAEELRPVRPSSPPVLLEDSSAPVQQHRAPAEKPPGDAYGSSQHWGPGIHSQRAEDQCKGGQRQLKPPQATA